MFGDEWKSVKPCVNEEQVGTTHVHKYHFEDLRKKKTDGLYMNF